MDDDVWDDDDDSYIFDTPTTYMQKDLEKLQETHSNVPSSTPNPHPSLTPVARKATKQA
jgi:hypothetical protein